MLDVRSRPSTTWRLPCRHLAPTPGYPINGMTPRGLASRAGMWSAPHRKTAIWGWLAFVVVAFAIGGAVGTKTLQHDRARGRASPGAPTRRSRTPLPKHAEEMVLIQSARRPPTDPAFRAVVADVQRRLAAAALHPGLREPLRAGQPRARSPATATRPCSASRSPATTPRRQDRVEPAARGRQRRAGGAPGLHDRRVRRRQRQQADQRGRSATTSARRWSPRCRSPC